MEIFRCLCLENRSKFVTKGHYIISGWVFSPILCAPVGIPRGPWVEALGARWRMLARGPGWRKVLGMPWKPP